MAHSYGKFLEALNNSRMTVWPSLKSPRKSRYLWKLSGSPVIHECYAFNSCSHISLNFRSRIVDIHLGICLHSMHIARIVASAFTGFIAILQLW